MNEWVCSWQWITMKDRYDLSARVSRQLEACLQFYVSLYETADEPIDSLNFRAEVVPDYIFHINFWFIKPKPLLINYNKNKTFQDKTHIYLDISSLKRVTWHYFCNVSLLSTISRYRHFICSTRIWIAAHHIFFTRSGSKNCFLCLSFNPSLSF